MVGEAGAGKSRLLWEFFKYIDGVEKLVRWHQGRCLSYGEGVAFWALAEMVRSRAGILEDESPASAREKLRASVDAHVAHERERRLVEPRRAELLGLEHRLAGDRTDLFAGWRLFFERIADDQPVVLAFEDLQWADSGLLEFIDHLLEWSAEHPIFILALGRPELRAARPHWTTDIALGPLPGEAMRELLGGLVPGLPEDVTARVLRGAEGMPLYAVETVRMLLDRGLLAQDGARYVVTGDVGELDVPETLHALAAARLDALDATERAVLQDAAVLGQSFSLTAVAAVGGRPPAVVEPHPRRARDEAGADPHRRPALARARAVRVPRGPSANGGLRHAVAPRPQEPPPPSPSLPQPPRARIRRCRAECLGWARLVSNQRPLACEASALPLSYAPPGRPGRLPGPEAGV